MYLKPPAKMPYKLAWGKHFKVLRKKPYHNRYLWELRHADCSPVLQKQERPLTWKEREKEISETIHFSKRRLHFVQNKKERKYCSALADWVWDVQVYESRESAWTHDGRTARWRQDWNREGYNQKQSGYICKQAAEYADIFLCTKGDPSKGGSHTLWGSLPAFCPSCTSAMRTENFLSMWQSNASLSADWRIHSLQ